MERNSRIKRLDDIWFEFLVASSAVTLLETRLADDPAFGTPMGWRRRDAIRWSDNLEATFLIRMYAEFEAALRDAWEFRFRQSTTPPMKDLITAIAARTRMPEGWLAEVDEIRSSRNWLVHAADKARPTVPLDRARARLTRYLSRLPFDW